MSDCEPGAKLTSEAVLRIFLKAVLKRNEDVAAEQRAASQSASQLLALIEAKAEVDDVRKQLQACRRRLRLDLKAAVACDPRADEIMQVLDEEFPNPDAGVWDMEAVCQRFSIPYLETAEGWEDLLRTIDETFQKLSTLEERSSGLSTRLDAALQDAVDARAEADGAKQVAAQAQEELHTAQRALSDAADMQKAEAARKDEGIRQRGATGYESAVLRSIARKCEVDNSDSLSQEELVQQICDVLETRLIPKGMRIQRRTR